MRIATPRTPHSWRTYYPAQRRLRLQLAFAGASGGGAWGCVALALARDPRASLLLSDRATDAPASLLAAWGGAAGAGAYVLALMMALPLGALVGAKPLDLLSHALGRRPAAMVCAVLVSGGGLVGAVVSGWGQVLAAVVAGLGVGGFAIVMPKLAHELAQRGHARLVPRLAAVGPAGAGAALIAGEIGALLPSRDAITYAWLVPILTSVAVCLLALGLPETPHWYAARGNIQAALASLQRMTDPLEAAVAIDWVLMDAGMLGEQRPLSGDDLRVDRVRRTIAVSAFFEAVQILPFGIAALCLAPCMLAMDGGGDLADAAGLGVPLPPAWSVLALATGWTLVAVVCRWRRSERMLLAWVMAGIGLAAMSLTCLIGVLEIGVSSALAMRMWIVVVAVALVAAQYLCVAPACLGAIDPLVPPWLLRSQRRAQAATRPLVQAVALGLPTALLMCGASSVAALAVCLGLELVGILTVLLWMPRLTAAMR